MLENELELQYLRALKHILIQNSESKYEIIREGYEQKKLSEEDALYFLMTMANRNLRKVLHGGCMGVNPSTGAFGLIYPSCSLMLDFDLSKGFPILTTRKMLTDYIIDFSSTFITEEEIIDYFSTKIEGLKSNGRIEFGITDGTNSYELSCADATRLDCLLMLNAVDMVNSLPVLMGAYAIHMAKVAHLGGVTVGNLICNIDAGYIRYEDIEIVQTQLSQKPFKAPTLWLNPNIDHLSQFTKEDIKVLNYQFNEVQKK